MRKMYKNRIETLGVAANADWKEVKAAYYSTVSIIHPDKERQGESKFVNSRRAICVIAADIAIRDIKKCRA